ALAAVAALDERIGEVLDVTGRLPDARMHEDRAVEPDDVVAELHHGAPPRLFHVVLELDAERPEVPRRAGSAVDLARREDEPSPLGERGDLVADVPVHLRPAAGKLAERGTRLHETRTGRGSARTRRAPDGTPSDPGRADRTSGRRPAPRYRHRARGARSRGGRRAAPTARGRR